MCVCGVRVNTCVCVHALVCAWLCVYVCVHTYVCACICVCACVHVCMMQQAGREEEGQAEGAALLGPAG